MKFSFKTLLGAVSANVSAKKEDRGSLSTSDKLKLARSAREGSTNKFSFFESDGQVGEMLGQFMTSI